MEREALIKKAIKLTEPRDEKGRRKVSIEQAAESCGIPKGTLRDRINGAQSRQKAHEKQQALSPLDEKAIIRWIGLLEAFGFPPRLAHVREVATILKGSPVGENWITRFLNRHPTLSSKFITNIDSKRIAQSVPEVLKHHFNLLKKVISSSNIQPAYTWNMDEKGFLMGLSDRCKVIVKELGRHGAVKIAEDGNRELITAVECVSAVGEVLAPLLIYKGNDHFMGWHQFTKGNTSKDFKFTYSPKGWTSRTLSLAWLKDHFEPNTRPPKDSYSGLIPTRLLIVDGHDSHVSMEFIIFAESHNIKLFCLPPHTTHLLQPLDVGLFSLLQKYYGHAVHNFLSRGGKLDTITICPCSLLGPMLFADSICVYYLPGAGIRKANFLPLYIEARNKAYTPQNIQNAFAVAGIAPFNPRRVLIKLPDYNVSQAKSSRSDPDSNATPQHINQTPHNSKVLALQIRRQVNAIKLESSINKWEVIDLIHRIEKFAIGKERDFQLLEHTFDQWKEAHNLNAKKDKRKLGKNLARILDGNTIATLYSQREEKDANAKLKRSQAEERRVLAAQRKIQAAEVRDRLKKQNALVAAQKQTRRNLSSPSKTPTQRAQNKRTSSPTLEDVLSRSPLQVHSVESSPTTSIACRSPNGDSANEISFSDSFIPSALSSPAVSITDPCTPVVNTVVSKSPLPMRRLKKPSGKIVKFLLPTINVQHTPSSEAVSEVVRKSGRQRKPSFKLLD